MNGLYLLGTWISLALVVPFAVFSYFDDVEFSVEAAVGLAILLYTATRLSWLAAQGKPRLLTITFFVFVYVMVGLAGSAQILAGQFPWQAMHHEEDVLPALLEVALAVVAYESGLLWYRLRPTVQRGGGLFQGLSLQISDRAAIWMSIIAVVLTFIGMAKLGFHNLLLTRAAIESAAGQIGARSEGVITTTILRTPSLIAFTVLLYNAQRRWRTFDRPRKRFYFTLGFFMAGLCFVANYPPAQSRSWLGAVLLTPAFALPRWRKWLAPFWIVGLAAGLTVIYPYLDMFRRATTVEAGLQQLNFNEAVSKKLIEKADFDGFQMTIDGIRYQEKVGEPAMGDNFIGAALFWVPRSMWSGKPYGTGSVVAEANGRYFTVLSFPLWAECFYAFGWVGVVVLLTLYGRLCAWAEQLYHRSLMPGVPDSLARLVVPYWAAFHTYMLRGDFLNATAWSSFGFLMLFATAVGPRIWGRGPGRPLLGGATDIRPPA